MKPLSNRNKLSDDANGQLKLPLFTIFVALILGSVIYYILFPSKGYFHADCADTIYWANASVEAGRTFDPSFYYAALLPFGTSLWLIPLIKLFGMTFAVHITGMIIFALVFSAAILYMGKQLAWSKAWALYMMAAMLLLLSGSEKLREIMWGHVIYYSLGLLLLILGLALLCRSDNGKRAWLSLLLLGVLTAGVATDGTQGLALFYVPLVGALVMERLCEPTSAIKDRQTKSVVIKIVVMTVSMIVGLLILYLVLCRDGISSPYANGFSLYSDSKDWLENLQMIFPNMISLFGISAKSSTPIMSVESLTIVLRIFALLTIFIAPLGLFIQYRKINNIPLKRLLWVHLFTTTVILFMVVFGSLGSANWRLIPMLGTGILTTVASFQWYFSEYGMARKTRSVLQEKHNAEYNFVVSTRIAAIGLIIILACSVVNGVSMLSMPSDYGQNNELHQLAEVLQNEGLEYGYATFWNAQALTLMTDQQSKVRNISVDEKGVRPRHYQSNSEWFQDQPDVETYFILLSEEELKILKNSEDWDKLQTVLSRNIKVPTGHSILVFNLNPWHVTTGGYKFE